MIYNNLKKRKKIRSRFFKQTLFCHFPFIFSFCISNQGSHSYLILQTVSLWKQHCLFCLIDVIKSFLFELHLPQRFCQFSSLFSAKRFFFFFAKKLGNKSKNSLWHDISVHFFRQSANMMNFQVLSLWKNISLILPHFILCHMNRAVRLDLCLFCLWKSHHCVCTGLWLCTTI